MMHDMFERTLEGTERSIVFNAEEIPEILNWKTGGDYSITLKIHQCEKTEHEDMPVRATFKISEIVVNDMTKEKTKDTTTEMRYVSFNDSVGGQDK